MENFTAKDKKIFDDMKQCVKDFGLNIANEKSDDGVLSWFSMVDYPGYNLGIIFSYTPSHSLVEVYMRYAALPIETIPAMFELLNHINSNLSLNHYFIDPETKTLVLRSGIYVTNYFLNKEMFKMVIRQNLGISDSFMPLIKKLIFTDQNPQSIMDEFYAMKDKIPTESLEVDRKSKEQQAAQKRPFIIHGCADLPVFPTHSHGMTELGMPEFLINHQAFGPKQNGGLIGASYDYFCNPENTLKLDAIKNGETVKLTVTDLKPDARSDTYAYCFRRVYPEFEMVKKAYDLDDPNQVSPDTWFVQIYVGGDDFALTDDYYKDGSKR